MDNPGAIKINKHDNIKIKYICVAKKIQRQSQDVNDVQGKKFYNSHNGQKTSFPNL